MLTEIQDQTQSLTEISSDYRAQLKEGRENAREESSALTENIEKIQKSQVGLTESLSLLTKQIDKQCQQAASEAEADEWARLRDDAEKQNTSLSDLKDKTSEGLGTASDAVNNISKVSGGNQHLAAMGSRLGGASGAIQSFSKLFGGFGSKKQPPSQFQTSNPTKRPPPQSTLSDGPQVRARTPVSYEKYQPRKHPVVNFLPPPQQWYTPAPGIVSFRDIRPTPPPLPPRTPTSTACPDTVETRPLLPPRPKSRPSLPPKPKWLNNFSPPPTLDIAKPDSAPEMPQAGKTQILSPVPNHDTPTQSQAQQVNWFSSAATSISSPRPSFSRALTNPVNPSVAIVPGKQADVIPVELSTSDGPETISFAEKRRVCLNVYCA